MAHAMIARTTCWCVGATCNKTVGCVSSNYAIVWSDELSECVDP